VEGIRRVAGLDAGHVPGVLIGTNGLRHGYGRAELVRSRVI
jgi:hypothetical protein